MRAFAGGGGKERGTVHFETQGHFVSTGRMVIKVWVKRLKMMQMGRLEDA